MHILLTGATGYIAQRLLPALLDQGHTVTCCVRDEGRFNRSKYKTDLLHVIRVDLLDPQTLNAIPVDIDIAYYLVHSMSGGGDFNTAEKDSAQNFSDAIGNTECRQVIYLGGIVNSDELSHHLSSRKDVEDILVNSKVPCTVLRAGIIVGSGSASFEIIRDLVEKLPVMIAPKWIHTRCQPVAIRNVIQFLAGVANRAETFNKVFDIYGPDVLTYKQMLLGLAEVRKLKRRIIVVPVMTPRLSSYWLYFVTATSYSLARNLVESMKVDVVAHENDLPALLNVTLIPYQEALRMAFDKIEQNLVLSSWTDALSGQALAEGVSKRIEVPVFGVLTDKRSMKVNDPERALDRIFAIGGSSGWYYGDWLWRFRGFLDRLFGGVGIHRGRKNVSEVNPGDVLDFWRVIYSNRAERRLLLYAEMKLPGEAWLEFKIGKDQCLQQTATFRPRGLWGRLYWYSVLPFHYFIFNGMMRAIGK